MEFKKILEQLGPAFEKRAEQYDKENQFAEKNFLELKERGVYKALVPKELGGGGVTYSELCFFLKDLAKFCPSTSLTLSMHQHLVAVLVYKHMGGDILSSEALRSIAEKDVILLSTGGGDWISSNGSAKKVKGGYRINCNKYFCSGAPIAEVAITSCAYNDGQKDLVLHFSVPLNEKGIEKLEDWDALGMRASGSHTVKFNNVFIPDEKVTLIRERGVWHPMWNLVVTYAFPVFMAPYVGAAEAIREKTINLFSKLKLNNPASLASLGKMDNHFKIAQWALDDLVSKVNNFRLTPDMETASQALQNKVLLATHARKSAFNGIEAIGGLAYLKTSGLERLYRDVFAGEFHPLHSGKQAEAMGNYLINSYLVDESKELEQKQAAA